MAKQGLDIITAFKDRAVVTKEELIAYLLRSGESSSDESIRQRISRYKRMGILITVRQGVYSVSEKPPYIHAVDVFQKKLSKLFIQNYPEINYCIWSSSWLYDFTRHQPSHYFYIFEVDQDMVETAFNLFKDNGIKAYLNPDEQTLQRYVLDQKNTVVIKSLISRAPLINYIRVKLPMLEKMIVDAYAEKKMLFFLQGQELQNIYKFSFGNYRINFSKLINYAKRRGIEKELTLFIKDNVNQKNIQFLND